MGEGHAFELLFLQLGLQLLIDPQEAGNALEDLHMCYDKAFAKKKRASIMSKQGDGQYSLLFYGN